MKEETYGMIWGTVALVLGLGILLFVFSNVYTIAQNPSEKLNEWVPVEIKGPTALFAWWSEDTSVDFSDISLKGDSEIKSWNWDFGDGSTSTEESPTHEYTAYGNYTVSLVVTDNNGKTNSAKARITVNEESNEGQVAQAMSFDLGLDVSLKRFAIITLLVGTFAVLVMIGGKFLVAGCRLLRPMPKSFKVRLKPTDMELEVPGKPKKVIEQKKKRSWFGKK